MVHHAIVDIFSAKMRVTSRWSYLEQRSIINGQYGNIKRPSTQIENQNILFTAEVFVQAVSKSSGCRFVDDSFNI